MPIPFSKTLRSLDERPTFKLISLTLGVALLVAWAVWFFVGRVDVVRVSETARIEIDRTVHRIQASIEGRVIAAHLDLNREVRIGDVLIELDARTQELDLAEAKASLQGLPARLEALRAQLKTEERILTEKSEADRSAVAEARARAQERATAARLATQEAERLDKLGDHVAKSERTKARGEAERLTAAALAVQEEIKKLESEALVRASEQEGRIDRLRYDLATLDGQRATEQARTARLEHEIDRRKIRAPIAGRIGEHRRLQTGEFVREEEVLATIVPLGQLRVIAEFKPGEALGRVRTGQPARLRLDAFPSIQYGSVIATVARVAAEPREGRILVELSVESGSPARVPLEHGLTGTAEVVIERVSPATLVLRAAGRWMGAESGR